MDGWMRWRDVSEEAIETHIRGDGGLNQDSGKRVERID